ncbi:MAG: flagellar motor switch protein FliN [Treponema sp.]|nr:flagellar motor switch protein FliN [Treponema sp.]
MSDGAISQDEIDALLSGVDMGGLSSSSSVSVNIDTAVLEKFADGIKGELISKINSMTGAEFSISNSSVEVADRDQFLSKIPEMVVAVMIDYSVALKGDHLFVLSSEFGQKLTSLINKEEQAELDDMALSVLSEVISNHTGTEINELSKDGKLPGLATNSPESVHVPKAMIRMPQGKFALFTFDFNLDGQVYTLWEAVSSDVATGMISSLDGGNNNNSAPNNSMDMSNMMGAAQPQMMGMNMGGMQMQGMQMQQPQMMGMNMGGMQMQPQMNMGQIMNTPNVQSIQYPNLMGGPVSGEQGNIGLIMDVFMEMTVELGRTKKQIKEILGMGEGTIIELDKLAGEPVDILVNHKPIAKGEVVVIDENFGVRVTEILSPMERVSDLH